MKHARTGLKIEHALYLAAQKKAGDLGQSFAAYVTDLIALDISSTCEGVDNIPDVKRVRGIILKKTPPGLQVLKKEMRDEEQKLAEEMQGKKAS